MNIEKPENDLIVLAGTVGLLHANGRYVFKSCLDFTNSLYCRRELPMETFINQQPPKALDSP